MGHLPPSSWMVNLHFPQAEAGNLSPLTGTEQRGFLPSYHPGTLSALLLLSLSSAPKFKVQGYQAAKHIRPRQGGGPSLGFGLGPLVNNMDSDLSPLIKGDSPGV